MSFVNFEWDELKNQENVQKHGISFAQAQYAFADPDRVIAEDVDHSHAEKRYFCFGKIGSRVVTLRFTHRSGKIRIFGAGFWRKGKTLYEQKNSKIHG